MPTLRSTCIDLIGLARRLAGQAASRCVRPRAGAGDRDAPRAAVPAAARGVALGAALAVTLAMALLLPAPCAQAQNKPYPPDDRLARDAVRIGVQSAAFPFAFNVGTAERPLYHGYAVDLCLEVLRGWRKRQGRGFDPARDVQWVEVTPRNRLLTLLAGEIDLECGSTSNTAGRRALGIAFSPTYFVSSVGLLIRPELRPHASSLMTLLQHARTQDKVFVTTSGSTSMTHLQELAADIEQSGGRRLKVHYGASHDESYQMLVDEPPRGHAFMMDQVLLAAALATRPALQRAGLTLLPWSPAPRAQECYGIMTRAENPARLRAGDLDLTDVVREVVLAMRRPQANGASPMQQLYERWFQRPLGAEDVRKGWPSGINLTVPPSPALSRVLVSSGADSDCD
jgi:glutamate/aspartate transport system substrate-binding protein